MATPLQNTLSRTLINGNLLLNGNLSVNSTKIALGFQAGNIINGTQSGLPNGTLSTAVGSYTGMNHTGTNNTFIGAVAGQLDTTTYFSRTGNNNTYVGYAAHAENSACANSTAIGAGAIITASNQITLGTSNETIRIPGSLSWAQSAFISCSSSNVGSLINVTQTFTWTSDAGSLLGFSAVSANTTITIPYTGYYLMTFSTFSQASGAVNSFATFTATTTTPETYIILRAGFPGVSGFAQTLTGTRMIKFTAGNTIVMTGINTTAGSIIIAETNLQVVRLF